MRNQHTTIAIVMSIYLNVLGWNKLHNIGRRLCTGTRWWCHLTVLMLLLMMMMLLLLMGRSSRWWFLVSMLFPQRIYVWTATVFFHHTTLHTTTATLVDFSIFLPGVCCVSSILHTLTHFNTHAKSRPKKKHKIIKRTHKNYRRCQSMFERCVSVEQRIEKKREWVYGWRRKSTQNTIHILS